MTHKQTRIIEYMQNESLQKFPCDFMIKVFGLATPEFETAVIMAVRKHIKDVREDFIRNRTSKDGKYLALTLSIHVTSKEQLDDIYRELTANPNVIMAL